MACPGRNRVTVEPRSDVEAVRLRPGMFIGSTDARGLHNLLFQLITSSLSAVVAGRGRSVRVVLGHDNAVEIEDDAPPESLDDTPLEFVFTRWLGHYCPPDQRDHGAYLNANALSERLSVIARADGNTCQHAFVCGVPSAVVQSGGPPGERGLTVAFLPDPLIFGAARFDANDIRDRLRQLALLHSGVRITFADDTTGTRDEFEYADGIRDYVRELTAHRERLHPDVIVVRGEDHDVRYEVGLQWCAGDDEVRRSFANHYFTVSGGTHDRGLTSGVGAGLRDLISSTEARAEKFEGEDLRTGLSAVVSVWLREPMFSGATRSQLANPEVEGVIEAVVRCGVREYFEANRGLADRVIAAVVRARDARVAATARRNLRKPRSGE